MTVRDLIAMAGQHPLLLAVVFIAVPALTWGVSLLHGRSEGDRAPWRYVYAVLVYMACVPGMLAAVLTAYSLLFVRANLLDADAIVYFLPIVAMIATLFVISRHAKFAAIPGFDRLSGLMVLLGITFIALLALEKTRIFLIFGGGLPALVAIAATAFALLKWGAYVLFRRRDEPATPPPIKLP